MPPAHRHRFPSLDAGAWVAAALVAASLLLGALVQQARGQPRTPSGTEPPASHPCEVGDLPDGLLESALATLTRPVTVTAPGRRWTALLPDRVSRASWWVARLLPRLYERLMARRLGKEMRGG